MNLTIIDETYSPFNSGQARYRTFVQQVLTARQRGKTYVIRTQLYQSVDKRIRDYAEVYMRFAENRVGHIKFKQVHQGCEDEACDNYEHYHSEAYISSLVKLPEALAEMLFKDYKLILVIG